MDSARELSSSPDWKAPAILYIIDEYNNWLGDFRNMVDDATKDTTNLDMAFILERLIKRADHHPGIRGLEVPQTFYVTLPSDRTLGEVMVDFMNRKSGWIFEDSWKHCPFSINWGLGVTDKAMDRDAAMEEVGTWERRKKFALDYMQEYKDIMVNNVTGYLRTLSQEELGQEIQTTVEEAVKYWNEKPAVDVNDRESVANSMAVSVADSEVAQEAADISSKQREVGGW